jgi:hypothetical protein
MNRPVHWQITLKIHQIVRRPKNPGFGMDLSEKGKLQNFFLSTVQAITKNFQCSTVAIAVPPDA